MTIWREASSSDLTRRPNVVGDHDSGSRRTPEQQATGIQTPERPWASAGITSLEEHLLVVLETVASERVVPVAGTSGLHELAGDGLATAIPLDSSREELARAILQRLDSPGPPPAVRLPAWDDCDSGLLELYRDAIRGSKPILCRDVNLAPWTRT
jgi:hypothetical protein